MIESAVASPCTDRVIIDQWHVVGVASSVTGKERRRVRLLETEIVLQRRVDGTLVAIGSDKAQLPLLEQYGYVWVSLGTPPDMLFDIPECREADRRNLDAGGIGVHTSAPRAVENFLDMGHFPFVHPHYLGIEPFTEVKPYSVTTTLAEGIFARGCRFFQPMANVSATEPLEVEYTYRVPHPYAAILYKTSPTDISRNDVIGLFLQPIDEESVVAYLFASFLDEVNSDSEIRMFSQLIFAQDKPILESQRPKKLPLDLRSELPVRSDATSLAYRKWLQQCGVRYGTVPVSESL
jgi:phenylpropionate dioxygenase-like ring-hydroxylating dioxygenase large terminal subunit